MDRIGSWNFFVCFCFEGFFNVFFCSWRFFVWFHSGEFLLLSPRQETLGCFYLPLVYLKYKLVADQMPYSSHPWWKMKCVMWRLPPTPKGSIPIFTGSLNLTGSVCVCMPCISASTVWIDGYCSMGWGFCLVLWLHGRFKWSFPSVFKCHAALEWLFSISMQPFS